MKKLLSIILTLCLIVSIVPMGMFTITASAAGNVYPSSQTINNVTTVPCTWYAWQQAYDRLGIALPNWGNAINWLNRAANDGYNTGSVPKENSIAVWRSSAHSYGHVSYVTAVNGNYMTVNEGGMMDGNRPANGTGIINGANVSSVVGTLKSAYSSCTLLGFIYLEGTPTVSVSYKPDSENTLIYDNNAIIAYEFHKSSYLSVSEIGMRVREEGRTYSEGYQHYQTPTYGDYSGKTVVPINWNLNTELNFTPKHATQYYYQFYTKANGESYWSAEYSFTTTGSHSYGSWSVIHAATCTMPGTKKRSCACGKYETADIDPTGVHSFYVQAVSDATCTECAKEIWACDECDYEIMVHDPDNRPALGHIYNNDCDIECNRCKSVRLLYGWKQNEGKWAYFLDGVMLKNCWKQDSSDWCYLGSDGYMRTNAWIMDSQGWCYVGDDGYCVTNSWMKDSHGWCYLNSEGRMATNSWILDSVGWCYVGGDGYCVTNTWVKDSHGWCYLNAEGRMATNAWVMDSVGWCYVGADGYAVTNCWKQDSVGWCYLNSEGSMTKSAWVYDGGWYYLDANGYMVTGWQSIGGVWYNFASSGVWLG